MKIRRSGILLHITSLPSPFGIGDLGPSAYRFADFLFEAGQSIWQVLPLEPTSTFCGNSPYCTDSAFAGNPLLISPERLIEDGYLEARDCPDPPGFAIDKVDYDAVSAYKAEILRICFERQREKLPSDTEFRRFCRENAWWLNDYSLFSSLKAFFGGVGWFEWPEELRTKEDRALKEWRGRLEEKVLAQKFLQFLFFKQWRHLKQYCNDKSIQLMGDIPIYVSHDSCDVWSNRQIFKLDGEGKPWAVAGVPPDYFSSTGQLWGNPVYAWDVLQQTRYAWWLSRLERNLRLFDLIRLDHFRGFVSCWEVPASEQTAVNGKWVGVPARDFFNTVLKRFPCFPVVAEDLGTITPDVREIMSAYGFPGMKVLLFAFGDNLSKNPYVPHNHIRNCVVYTGTHDNNTVRGWFRTEASKADKGRLFSYLGRIVGEEGVHWELIRLAMMSVAETVIIPMQDVLGLDERARMNLPAVEHGNWEWRLKPGGVGAAVAEELSGMTRIYGRS